MKRDEFQEIVNDVLGMIKTGRGKKAVYTPEEYIVNRWHIGGLSGGSCWNSGDDCRYYAEEGEPEPPFADLDVILERVCPQITYLQYKKLERLIVMDSERRNDYYGNYSIYAIKRLAVEDLWKFLVENGYGED